VDSGRSQVLISGTRKLSRRLERDLRGRAAIEPELSHTKNDGFLGRNFLKEVVGDMQNITMSGARAQHEEDPGPPQGPFVTSSAPVQEGAGGPHRHA